MGSQTEFEDLIDHDLRECPVCGRTFLYVDHCPENPDPDHEPHCNGVVYVHEVEDADEFESTISEMCTVWEDGTSDHYLDLEDT